MTDEPFDGIVAIDGGWRLKTTEWCHVEVQVMFGGQHRLVETYLNEYGGYHRGWCYVGEGARVRAFLAGLAWDGSPETEPDGWVREILSGRRRPGGDPARETRDWPAPRLDPAVAAGLARP